ncbi:MAG: asparagine synthase-related protein [Euryarchaeota archaeon]
MRVDDFEHKVCTDNRTFYFDGAIDGLVRSDYTVEDKIEVPDVVSNLSSCLPRVSGRYAGVSIRDGTLDFAASDIGAVQELYYTMTETEVIVSTDFFELAKAEGQLEYDASQVRYFIKEGHCRKGKTTFDGVYRLPPGETLECGPNGVISTKSYIDHFQGVKVTFDVLKNAINDSVESIIKNDPHFEEVVSFSGGVDSSVLLSLIKGIKDATTVTFRFVPSTNWNQPDVIRAERAARKLHVAQEVVDVDLNEIQLDYLEEIVPLMPFAAHLGINVRKVFETLENRKKRLWSGIDLDMLYCYGATTRGLIINRFLVSDVYGRMLIGVTGYPRYQLVKKALDLSLVGLYRLIRAQRIQTPNTVGALVEYLSESHDDLALRVGGEQNDRQSRNVETSESISVGDLRKLLFDEVHGAHVTGNNHKIQLLGAKLKKTECALPYSTPALVHLLRNLNLSWLDVLLAKRLMYRYARELGLYRSDFRVDTPLQTPRGASQNWSRTFESTSFGTELCQKTADLATQIGFVLDVTDLTRWEKQLGLLWINNVREELGRIGVVTRWPIFTGEHARI